MNKVFATSAVVAVTTTTLYLYKTYQRVSPIASSQIESSDIVPISLETSKAVLITNPNGHVPITDTRWIVTKSPANSSDEAILAKFVTGFFGGYVFGPERVVLQIVKPDIVKFSLLKDVPVTMWIWSVEQLSDQKLPPLNAMLFGAFRMVDRKIDKNETVARGQQTHSYVDFAFGSDNGSLAGVHRFSVWRTGSGEGNVKIEFAHSGCNPRKNEKLKPEILQTFHLAYAQLLFREGIMKVFESQVDGPHRRR